MQTVKTPSLAPSQVAEPAISSIITPFPVTEPVLSKVDLIASTIVARAYVNIAGFEELYHRLERKIVLSGKSVSTLKNYGRQIAQVALHFNQLPTQLDSEQIQDYLYSIKSSKSPSNSYFKHAVYGLRYLFRLEGLDERIVELPSLKKDKKLPVVLSKPEVKALLVAPALLKHRLLLAMTYGCGLRCSEVRNLKVKDVDLHRGVLHIRQGKGRKDRYVPLGKMLKRGILQYLEAEQVKDYFFTGKQSYCQLSQKGVQWVVKEARKKAKILKPVCVHTLRHSYATHLLEDGLDILSIKDLLGHESIETTLVYLHIAQVKPLPSHSPLDTLYQTVNVGTTGTAAAPTTAATGTSKQ